ncbi:MAG: hypothetical protein ACI3XG_01595 [Faecousia sp.]
MTQEELLIKKDRMRFIKNKLPANLAILAILFDVFYFVSIYQSDVRDYYYTILIGASILYNLVFMLACFLSSEGIKNYKGGYAWLLAGLGIGQIIRIFILPAQAHATELKKVGRVMGDSQYTFVVVCLVISALCCLAAAVIGGSRSRTLKQYQATLETKSA